MGAPRQRTQLATRQPEPKGVGAGVGAGVGLPLTLRCSTPSVDAPLATQLEPVAVCSTVKPCDREERRVEGCQGVLRKAPSASVTGYT